MASSVKYVRVGPNSASIEAARRRVFNFFKTACRSIPAIMEVYNRDDVVTLSQLRSNVTSKIRKNAHVNNPKVYYGILTICCIQSLTRMTLKLSEFIPLFDNRRYSQEEIDEVRIEWANCALEHI